MAGSNLLNYTIFNVEEQEILRNAIHKYTNEVINNFHNGVDELLADIDYDALICLFLDATLRKIISLVQEGIKNENLTV